MVTSVTLEEARISATPMEMKAIPMEKRLGITVRGVRIGFQACNLCCLKAVSTNVLRGYMILIENVF